MTDDKPPLDHKVKRPFAWIPASSHSDPALFRARMQDRMQKAHEERERLKREQESKVVHPTFTGGKRT